MAFPWTLQRYIFKEMGKTVLLAAAGLTGVLGLGGGVFHMMKVDEVTPEQILRVLGLVLPVAAALTLPIAVLFGAAATYGRLGADNEFVACRSGGINLYILFLPAVVLSLACAVVTFVLINFVIPGMVGNLNAFIVGDPAIMIRQHLARPGKLKLLGKYRIYADPDDVFVASPTEVVLRRGVFAEIQDGKWLRYGSFTEARLVVDPATKRAGGILKGLNFFDRAENRFVTMAEASASRGFQSLLPVKVRFLKLGALLHLYRFPGEWHDVAEETLRLRMAVGRALLYEDLAQQQASTNTITLSDRELTYRISTAKPALPPHEGGLELEDVTVLESRGGRTATMRAERAIIELVHGDSLAECGVRVSLYGAELSDGSEFVHKDKETLDVIPLDPQLVTRVEAFSDEQLLSPDVVPNDVSDRYAIDTRRTAAMDAWAEAMRRFLAALHERLAFSVAVVPLVLLGAALGIIFRGSHALTAFGISFVPSLIVYMAVVMGKQMAHNDTTHGSGLMVIWSGLAFVTALDAWVFVRVLRR